MVNASYPHFKWDIIVTISRHSIDIVPSVR